MIRTLAIATLLLLGACSDDRWGFCDGHPCGGGGGGSNHSGDATLGLAASLLSGAQQRAPVQTTCRQIGYTTNCTTY